MKARHPLLAFLVGAIPVFGAMWLLRPAEHRQVEPRSTVAFPASVDWIAVVTGGEPASTQHSLAQDVLDVREAFGTGGVVLFGGGRGSLVQVLDASRPSGLRERLAGLFDPRDRAVTYVPGPNDVDGPATWGRVADAFDVAADDGERPLFVFIGGHGDGGAEPVDSVMHLWGGTPLGVSDLVRFAGERPLRLVQTTCFGGGFGEIIFRRGDAELGLSDVERCGVFATSWDQEASGCDPDPDRGRQNGYTVHFLDALRGRTRANDGARLDLDGDGHVSLLEAHTQARIASRSIDVPSTTSERWLLDVVENRGLEGPGVDVSPDDVREELEVVRRLGRALGHTDEEAAQRAFAEMQLELRNGDIALEQIERRLDGAYFDLRIRLLERWPRIDDPWDADFEATLAREGGAIDAWLSHSPEALAYREARAAHDEALLRLDALRVRASPLRRLVEAWDTLAFARLVRERDRDWAAFRRIRACERSVPGPSSGP